MDRKGFLKKTAQTCVLCCGAIAGFGASFPKSIDSDEKLSSDLGQRMLNGSKSPDWRKAEKAISWIKNMVANIDEQLDEEAKIKLLNACGRSCYIFAVGAAEPKKPSKNDVEGFLFWIENNRFKVERGVDKTIIYYGWQGKQSPQGLSAKEGYCLCPIVEDDIPDLSKSFCNCSAGYVKELIEREIGPIVKRVEVIESIKRGDKDCKFKIEISNTY